jgi:hypothetical protein
MGKNNFNINYYIDKESCAPCQLNKKNGNNKKFKSCYSLESLLNIAKAWNNHIKSNKTKSSELININTKSRIQLWKDIQNRLKNTCNNNELCWKRQDFIKRLKDVEIELYTFKPSYPKEWIHNKYSWLSTYDIYYVMKQYDRLYDDFVFFGPIPADCPVDIHCELSKFDIEKMKKSGIHKIGIIYNLDKSNQGGSHWVAIYIDNKHNEINYYDSYGSLPTPLINKFIKKVVEQYQKLKITPVVIFNDKRHQFKHSECGIYSMNFILGRVNGATMYDISSSSIPDENMINLRKLFYNVKY